MQKYAALNDVQLAPHGKTTMSPQIFKMQLDNGCWGISVATVAQASIAYIAGAKRIILANQLVGKQHFETISKIIAKGDLEFFCFVDSEKNVSDLENYFSCKSQLLNVLLEIGVAHGRCGCRNSSTTLAVANKINESSALKLKGIAFYEGVIHGKNPQIRVESFIDKVIQLTRELDSHSLFDNGDLVISGAGSAWYDVVVKKIRQNSKLLPKKMITVIRPGCYIIHDKGIYQDAQNEVLARCNIASQMDFDLTNSLEVWAYVLSRPEEKLVIIGMGKRDVAFDSGLPKPKSYFQKGMKSPEPAHTDWSLIDIMDQHCMLKIESDCPLQPGDLVGFSTSHPCLTLDKWRVLSIVDDQYNINEQIQTRF